MSVEPEPMFVPEPMVTPDPMFAPHKASLPYAGTTGSAGSETSRTRAEREAADGTAQARQIRIIGILADAGAVGATWKEISDHTGQHHGQVSGALSALHKEGQIAALRFHRRNGSGVYVLPSFVLDRPVRAFRSNAAGALAQQPNRPKFTRTEEDAIARLAQALKQAGDRPVPLLPSTGRILLGALKRLSR